MLALPTVCSTLGFSDFIRVPLPAAKITTEKLINQHLDLVRGNILPLDQSKLNSLTNRCFLLQSLVFYLSQEVK